MRHEPARDVALRILDACFARDALASCSARDTLATCSGAERRVSNDASAVAGLEPFQADAYHRLRHIIEQRGGAILADSVGLGKTHVAVALIRDAVEAGGTALITAPAQLRAHWKRHLRGLPRCRWVSHTTLSRGTRRTGPAGFIVVDEAHAFRNPRTRRYAGLAVLCEQVRVLLVTATPVNNSLFDFLHLIRLFAPRDLFADIGVPDLTAAVEAAARGGSGAELRRVADAVMVRRTRGAITHRQTGAPAPALRFPSAGPIEVLHYDLGAARADLLACVQHVIPALTFPAHGLAGDAVPSELMRLGLLKRLESGTRALHASVRRHIRLLDQFVAAARDGFLFDYRRHRASSADIDGAVQLSFPAIALRPWPPGLDRERLTDAAMHDLRALHELSTILSHCDDRTDPKLDRLQALLDTCADRVLLFTEYRETAHHLWRALAVRPGVALIHGSDARLGRGRSSRRAVIERFAPVANGARVPRAAEQVHLLIATDVLAEGLNLQDAAVVVSYDLPWNPIRLAQRIGRIDRLGSPHTRIRAVAFVPDRGVDQLLGLMKRIRRKLRHIRIVGGDAPWSLARARRTARVIADIDAASDERERLRALWLAAPERRTRCPDSSEPVVGVLPWQDDRNAALCCFRIGRDTVLVLTADGRRPRVGTAACWAALGEALNGADTVESAARTTPEHTGPTAATAGRTACTAEPSTRTVERMARSAERAARAALSAGRRHDAAANPDRGAALAGAAVLRWLADRPGGATPQDAERADAILRRVGTGARAGTDIRIRDLVHGAESAGDIVESLSRLTGGRGSSADHPAAPAAAPELAAVILLVATARDPE